MAGVNLHIHSTCSDGTLSINEIISSSIQLKMTAISITDHGNADGLLGLHQTDDITVIPGVELECSYKGQVLHILGYHIYAVDLKNRLHELSAGDDHRRAETLRKLLECGIFIDDKEVQRLLKLTDGFRKSVAEMIIKNDYASNMREAFTKYLGAPGLAYVPPVATANKAISLLSEVGGVPVLAHPHKSYKGWTRDKIITSIHDLTDMGLKGIEVYCWDTAIDDIEFYSYIADSLNLVATGGSDFHSPELQPLGFDFPNSERCMNRLRELHLQQPMPADVRLAELPDLT